MVGGYIHHIISDIAYMGHILPNWKCLRSWTPTSSSKTNTEEWALLVSNSSDLPEIFIWNELHWFLEIFFFPSIFSLSPFFLLGVRACCYRYLPCTWWKLYTNLVAFLHMLLLRSQNFSHKWVSWEPCCGRWHHGTLLVGLFGHHRRSHNTKPQTTSRCREIEIPSTLHITISCWLPKMIH